MASFQGVVSAFAELFSARGSPLGFFALIVVLIFLAAVGLFSRSSERSRLIAFAGLIVVASAIAFGLFVKPPPLAPNEAQEQKLALPPPQQIQTQPPAGSGLQEGSGSAAPAITAWAYYEVGRDGRPTRDGQLEVMPPGTPLPDFKQIAKGLLLRTLTPVNLRASPPDTDEDLNRRPVATLKAGSCLAVAMNADPTQAIAVRNARSGGWLYVTSKKCPDS